MTTRSYVRIDVSKERLDIAVLGKGQEKQVNNTEAGIAELVDWLVELQPELIVVEATGGCPIPSWFASGASESCPGEAVCACVWVAGQDR